MGTPKRRMVYFLEEVAWDPWRRGRMSQQRKWPKQRHRGRKLKQDHLLWRSWFLPRRNKCLQRLEI